MFCVITPSSSPRRSSSASARCAPLGCLPSQRREALAVEAQKRAGSRRQTEMCATSIGSTFAHSPVPGERKSGIPDGTEIPAPVSATTEPARADQLRQPARASALTSP